MTDDTVKTSIGETTEASLDKILKMCIATKFECYFVQAYLQTMKNFSSRFKRISKIHDTFIKETGEVGLVYDCIWVKTQAIIKAGDPKTSKKP